MRGKESNESPDAHLCLPMHKMPYATGGGLNIAVFKHLSYYLLTRSTMALFHKEAVTGQGVRSCPH